MECYSCGIDKSIEKKTGYSHWLYNHDIDNNVLCMNCNARLITYPKRDRQKMNNYYLPRWRAQNPNYMKEYTKKRLNYKGRLITLKTRIKIGVCNTCNKTVESGQINFTTLHHYAEYHDNNPVKDTIELCPSCHGKESWKLGQTKHPPIRQSLRSVIF